MEIVKISINQGGDRETVLEVKVPSFVPTSKLLPHLTDIYKQEHLPEWHESSFHAVLQTCAALEQSKTEPSSWEQLAGDDEHLVHQAMQGMAPPQDSSGEAPSNRRPGPGDDLLLEGYAMLMQSENMSEAVLEMERKFRAAAREMVGSRKS
jgi:hypothetical protein